MRTASRYVGDYAVITDGACRRAVLESTSRLFSLGRGCTCPFSLLPGTLRLELFQSCFLLLGRLVGSSGMDRSWFSYTALRSVAFRVITLALSNTGGRGQGKASGLVLPC